MKPTTPVPKAPIAFIQKPTQKSLLSVGVFRMILASLRTFKGFPIPKPSAIATTISPPTNKTSETTITTAAQRKLFNARSKTSPIGEKIGTDTIESRKRAHGRYLMIRRFIDHPLTSRFSAYGYYNMHFLYYGSLLKKKGWFATRLRDFPAKQETMVLLFAMGGKGFSTTHKTL